MFKWPVELDCDVGATDDDDDDDLRLKSISLKWNDGSKYERWLIPIVRNWWPPVGPTMIKRYKKELIYLKSIILSDGVAFHKKKWLLL